MGHEGRASETCVKGPQLRHLDRNLFATLASGRLFRRFGDLNVSADQVPAVGVPTSSGMPVTEQEPSVLNQRRQRDLDRHSCPFHPGTVSTPDP